MSFIQSCKKNFNPLWNSKINNRHVIPLTTREWLASVKLYCQQALFGTIILPFFRYWYSPKLFWPFQVERKETQLIGAKWELFEENKQYYGKFLFAKWSSQVWLERFLTSRKVSSCGFWFPSPFFIFIRLEPEAARANYATSATREKSRKD